MDIIFIRNFNWKKNKSPSIPTRTIVVRDIKSNNILIKHEINDNYYKYHPDVIKHYKTF